ncbi:PTS system mannose/fructose/sorbose family transporter subunit IID [Enterococcus casseliflavus]|uniref:PTS system mannose/fructose/sorbose family transporter subunit IID n=1 Tax=Enterococcus casseliflavus TaxID=37734 RepID=UPI003D0C8A34
MKMMEKISTDEKKMLNRIFLRSFIGQASRAGGQARQHAIGFVYSIMPALDEFYSEDKKGKKEALVRHTQFFNITSILSTLVMGIVASMEKEKSMKEDFDEDSIIAIKVALMGPLSGIGDSIFIGVLRVIAGGIGISFAAQGSILGPILFILIYNVPTIILRYYLTYMGYISGSDFITRMYDNGYMKIITKAASILGLIMIGAMTATTVRFNTVLEIPVKDGDPVLIQTYLDQIFKGLVPLTLTLGCKKLLDKKININMIMILVIILALVLALLKVV